MGQEVFQSIDQGFLSGVLRSRSLHQKEVAEQLGENEKNFSRWLNQGQIPSRLVWRLRKALSLTSGDMRTLLMIPEFKVFFRRQFLGEVPKDVQSKAVVWAQTFLNLSPLHSNKRIVKVDLSDGTDPVTVAETIKRLLQLPDRITVETMISSLRAQGIEVAFVPFSLLRGGSLSEETKEDAFSVTNGERCCIFIDTQLSRDKAPFVIAHELAHLFRSRILIDRDEEKICNRIAGEIIFPRSYFNQYRESIALQIGRKDLDITVELIEEIRRDLGGEFWGILIHLRDLSFISSRSDFWGTLNQIGRKRRDSKVTIHSSFFADFKHDDYESLSRFWCDPALQSFPEYIFFNAIRVGIQLEKVSARAFAELFSFDLSVADEIVTTLRYQFKQERE